jgi:carboxyl-terminal processing protease
MVVLTDKSSASASEILAGALQDANRAVIVGQSSTYGKGTVQKTFDIAPAMPLFAAKGEAGTLKLTTQKFYRPSGSSTQILGVTPDIVLPDATDAYPSGEALLRGALKRDFIRPAGSLKPLDRELLFVSRLQELSAARVKSSRDFEEVVLETRRAEKRIGENRISLNAAERRTELLENEGLRKQRDSERQARFSALQMQDRVSMEFYDLSLDDVAADMPLKKKDLSKPENEPIRTASGESPDPANTPAWPSGLDLQKRESLMVLRDMIDIERAGRTATVFKKNDLR